MKLRNKKGVIIEITDREIRSKILGGKLNGQEDLCFDDAPGRWIKISAIPEYYDLLISRVLPGMSIESAKKKENRREEEAAKKSSENKTTRVSRIDVNPSAPDENATHHTVQRSEHSVVASERSIAELFEKSGSFKKSKDKMSVPLLETRNEDIVVDISAIESKPKSKARLFLVAVAALLVCLWVLRGPERQPSVPEKTESVAEKTDGGSTFLSSFTTQILAEVKNAISDDSWASLSAATKLIEKMPPEVLKSSAEAHGLLAYAYSRMYFMDGQEEEKKRAESAIATAKSLDPHASYNYRAQAYIALKEKRDEEGKKLVEVAIQTGPTLPENAILTAELLISYGSLERALEALKTAENEKTVAVRRHYLLGNIFSQLKLYDSAKQAYLKVLEINPFHFSSGAKLAQIAVLKGQAKSARAFYESVGKYANFGSPEEKKKHFEQKRQLEKTLGISKVEEITLATGADLHQSGLELMLDKRKQIEAESYLQGAVWLDPQNGAYWLSLGDVVRARAKKAQDYDKAAFSYALAIEFQPEAYQPYLRLGALESTRFNFESAEELLMRAKDLGSTKSDVYLELGRHFLQRNDYTKAYDLFKQSRDLNPQNGEVHYLAGLIVLKAKQEGAEAASKYFETALLLNGDDYDAMAEWLKLKVAQYQKTIAVKFVRSLLEKQNDNPNLYWVLGQIYASNNEYARAISFYQHAISLKPQFSKAMISLAECNQKMGRMDTAVDGFVAASDSDVKDGGGYFQAAEILVSSAKHAAAVPVLKKLIARFPRYPASHRLLGLAFQGLRKSEDAVFAFRTEIQNHPGNLKTRVEFAEILRAMDKYEPAIEELNTVVSLASNESRSEVYLKVRAYILMSECYRMLRNFSAAEGVVQLAFGIDSQLPEVQRELGFVYQGLQRDAEAASAFEEYLNRQPTAQDAGSIRNIIRQLKVEN